MVNTLLPSNKLLDMCKTRQSEQKKKNYRDDRACYDHALHIEERIKPQSLGKRVAKLK